MPSLGPTHWMIAQALLVAAGLMAFGYLIADAVAGKRDLDGLIRWALAFPAVVAYAFLLMVLHMASRGRVFSNPWLVRGLTISIAIGLVVRRVRTGRRAMGRDRTSTLAAGLLVLAGVLAWGWPVARMEPLGATADMVWHMGWAGQLLNGHSTPTAAITGSVPNYYPWMFHALIAMIAAFVRPGRAFQALGPLQLMQVSGTILGLFGLGRLMLGSWLAGSSTALLGALTGGFGFFRGRVSLVMNPTLHHDASARRFFGDLLFVRSPNAAFANLVPPLPRDLALTLLIAFLLLAAIGLREQSRVVLVAVGFVLGLVGLSSAEAFFAGLGTALVLTFLAREMGRLRVGALLLVPAALTFSFWLVPLAASYVRLGGFVNTTTQDVIHLPLWAILGGWGVVTPLAILEGGRRLVSAVRKRKLEPDPLGRLPLALLLSSVVLIGSLTALGGLGAGFDPIGRLHRYWPILDLSLVLYAGLGLARLLQGARRLHMSLAVGMALTVLGLALPSPFIASAALPSRLARAPRISEALLGGERNLVSAVAQAGSGPCVVAIGTSSTPSVFAYTGYRFVFFSLGARGHTGNQARIRWREIFQHIQPETDRKRDSVFLIRDAIDEKAWRALVDEYGVDLVVINGFDVGVPPFDGYPVIEAGRDPVAVLRVHDCGGGGG
jgi:hypothetical protein